MEDDDVEYYIPIYSYNYAFDPKIFRDTLDATMIAIKAETISISKNKDIIKGKQYGKNY